MDLHRCDGDAVRGGRAAGFVAALVSICAAQAAGPCSGTAAQRQSLELPVGDLRALQAKPTPVSDILDLIGVRTLRGRFLAGLEVRSDRLAEPEYKLPSLGERSSVATALAALLAQMPSYRCSIVAPGFVNIRPQAAGADPSDPLNRTVTRFRWKNRSVVDLFEFPQDYFEFLRPHPKTPSVWAGGEELRGGSGGRVPDGALRNTTVLGVFNHMVLLFARARYADAKSKHPPIPALLWGWFCIEGQLDPQTGLRRTRWSALETAPRPGPPPPPPPPIRVKPR